MITDIIVAKKFMSLHSSATSRGIQFELSLNKVRQLLSAKRCYYTNKPFDDENKRSIDRVDNNIGYIDSNVVACELDFNQRKGDLTVEDITLMYEGVKKKIKKVKK